MLLIAHTELENHRSLPSWAGVASAVQLATEGIAALLHSYVAEEPATDAT